MVINDSTISGNEVQGGSAGVTGGGISNEGSLTIRNSTISGNTSSNDGGGIGNFGTLNLDSVTVTGNTASGDSLGAIGAGVYNGGFGSLATRNSILAGNLGAEDCYTLLSITDGGHNLVQTQANCGFVDGANGNIVGQSANLGLLLNNGGPTLTHALLAGSPAIDAGDTTLTTDQRGITRPQGAADDIGAFEVEVQATGSITIVKEANPEGEQEFDFLTSIGGPGSTFTLKDNGSDPNSITFDNLAPSTYNVQEIPPAGWQFEDLQCSGGADIVKGGPNVTIYLSAGEDVTCTYTNEAVFDLTIVKAAVGGDDTFEFEKTANSVVDFVDFSLTTQGGTAQTTLADLPAGFLEIEEIAPAGWELTDLECVGVTNDSWGWDGTRARIQAAPGDDVTCTFTNVKGPFDLTIVKAAVGGDDTFEFEKTVDSDIDFADFSLTTVGGMAQTTLTDLPAGFLDIAEIVPAGWQLTHIECVGVTNDTWGSDFPRARIDASPGDDITCTFTNEKQTSEAKVRVTESYAASRVVEGQTTGEGSRACYWVTLSEAPVGGNVVINLGPPALGEVTLDKSQVTLDASNWDNLTTSDRSNFVCIQAVDDTVDDGGADICRDGNDDVLGNGNLVTDKECGDHTDTVPHSIASASASNYNTGSSIETKQPDGTFTPGDTLTVLVQDNDDPGNCPVVAGNLIANYCFENGSNPWLFFTNGAGSYTTSTTDPYQGNYAAEVQIDQQGSNVQLYQKDITLEPNTVYELSFAAYSTNGNDLSVVVHEHDDDFTNYGLNRTFNLSSGWATYQTTFTTKNFNAPVNDARLRFWLAPFDANNMTYRIDYVVLRKVNSGNPPIPPVLPPYVPAPGLCTPTPGNLISNPGYESGTTSWSFYTDGAGAFKTDNNDPYECANNALVSISQSGSNVQLYQKDISLQGGETYLLWLAARSSNGQDAKLYMHKHSTPYTNYGLNGVELDLSSSWQVFVVEFTAIGTAPLNDARLRIWLAPYDAAGTKFEFDMVTLVPKSAVAGPTEALLAATGSSELTALDGAARGGRRSRPMPQVVPADVVLYQGDFIDSDEAGRLVGGYVPDNGAAYCRNARPSRDTLLPADGKMAKINIVGLGSVKNVTITKIWQDEGLDPVENATFEGGTAWLRKAQNEGGIGRTYTIHFEAVYGDGQTCDHEVIVSVPEDRKTPAVFSGQQFDATRVSFD